MQPQSIPLRVANWVLLGVGLFVLTFSRNPILYALRGGFSFLGIFLIERGYSAALPLVVLATLSACSPVEHHTDQQAAMARMTFSPEKCEEVGEVYYKCSGEHALPGASGSAKNDNDASLLRGFCQQGFHYESGGCQKD